MTKNQMRSGKSFNQVRRWPTRIVSANGDRAAGPKSTEPHAFFELTHRIQRPPSLGLDGFLLIAGEDGPVVKDATPGNLAELRAAMVASYGEAGARRFEECVATARANDCAHDSCGCVDEWLVQRLDVEVGSRAERRAAARRRRRARA